MSCIQLTAGYLGGIYMQTWDIYNDPGPMPIRDAHRSSQMAFEGRGDRYNHLPAHQCEGRTDVQGGREWQAHPGSTRRVNQRQLEKPGLWQMASAEDENSKSP
jgi:hypothetical protein